MDCLSKNFSTCLKGIFALCVVLHHLYQYTKIISNKYLAIIFASLGYLSVAIFFFFSGYGLTKSYNKSQQAYIDNFLKRRILPIYCFYIFIAIISYTEKSFFGNSISLTDIAKTLTFGSTIITNGWFLQTILIFYFIFWLIFSRVYNNKLRITMLFLGLTLYITSCFILKLGGWWYNSIWAFLLGVIIGTYEEKFIKLVNNYLLSLSIISLITFTFFFALTYICSKIHLFQFKGASILFQMITALCFCIFVIITSEFINKKHGYLIANKFTNFLGQHSFEIYVCHGFFLPFKKWGGN